MDNYAQAILKLAYQLHQQGRYQELCLLIIRSSKHRSSHYNAAFQLINKWTNITQSRFISQLKAQSYMNNLSNDLQFLIFQIEAQSQLSPESVLNPNWYFTWKNSGP